MGISTHVSGFKPPDEKWRKMRAAWEACEAVGIEPPGEVIRFFEGDAPDEGGVRIAEESLRETGAVREWSDEMREGLEVDVATLLARHPDVTVIRFYNSW